MIWLTVAIKKHFQEGQRFAQNSPKKLLSVHRTLVKISPELEARSGKGHSLKWKAIEMSNE